MARFLFLVKVIWHISKKKKVALCQIFKQWVTILTYVDRVFCLFQSSQTWSYCMTNTYSYSIQFMLLISVPALWEERVWVCFFFFNWLCVMGFCFNLATATWIGFAKYYHNYVSYNVIFILNNLNIFEPCNFIEEANIDVL